MTYENDDPFAGHDRRPAVSFKDQPIGTTVRLIVDEPPKRVQARDYQTGEPAFWTNRDGTKSEKWTVVTGGHVNGEPRSLWAPDPSQLFAAIREAQKSAGARIAEGGTLTVTLTERRANPDKPRNAPQNIYAVTYTPPAAADPFADQAPPATPPVPPAQPAATGPVSVPQTAAPVVDLAAVKAKLAPLAAAGLSAAQIAGMAPSVGITAPDGSALTEASVAAILAA